MRSLPTQLVVPVLDPFEKCPWPVCTAMETALDGGARDRLAKQAFYLRKDLSHPHVRLSLGQDLDDGPTHAAEFTSAIGLGSVGLRLLSPPFTATPTCETLE
jgi:hypothetical protein